MENRPYRINYISKPFGESYYQLERKKDDAILFAHTELAVVQSACINDFNIYSTQVEII